MTFQIDPMVAFAILGLVNFVKALGAEGKALTAISMLIGIAIAVAVLVLPAEAVKVGLIGILSGLCASGFYDFGNLIGTKTAAPR